MQALSAALEYLPTEQLSQRVSPAVAEYLPAAHWVHGAVTSVQYMPAWQPVQLVLPLLSWYQPAAH